MRSCQPWRGQKTVEDVRASQNVATTQATLRRGRNRCHGGPARSGPSSKTGSVCGRESITLQANDESWIEYWWNVFYDYVMKTGAGRGGSSSSTAAAAINLDSQNTSKTNDTRPDVETQPTQMVWTCMWDPSQLDAEDHRVMEQAIKDEEEIRRGRDQELHDEALAMAREEVEQEDPDFEAEWLEGQRQDEELRRAKEEADVVKREEADRKMAMWLQEQERQQEANRLRRKREEEREVHQLNAEFAAAKYRDWERWAVLHEPPSAGQASRARSKPGYTVIEASVRGRGKTGQKNTVVAPDP